MEYVKAAAGLAGAAFDVGAATAEHLRTNHLHREAICQSLRIHEQEANAAKAYHRVNILQSNRMHARELLQSELQHAEEIGIQKRMAFRENLRDEWAQITGKTDTVLVVNTLMLGLGFALLVEGNVPGHIPVVAPVAPTVYYAIVAFAISLLLLSVRLSMILRIRVGRMIVKEMRRTLIRARTLENTFRSSLDYTQSNIPIQTTPACDDERYKESTEPITATQIAKVDPMSIPAFITSRYPNNVDDDCEPQMWQPAGFSIRSHLACSRRRADVTEQLGCGRRGRTSRPVEAQHLLVDGCACNVEQPQEVDGSDGISKQLRRQPSGHSLRSWGSCTTSEGNGSDLGSGSRTINPSKIGHARNPSPFTPRLTQEVDVETGLGEAGLTLEALAATHVELSKAREQEDLDMEKRLDDLRLCYCKPYDLAAQESFFSGTLMLLVGGCFYAILLTWSTFNKVGRPLAIPYNAGGIGPFFPTQPLAGYAFIANACITLVGLAITEVKNRTAMTQWSSKAKVGGAKGRRYSFGNGNSSSSLDISEKAWTPDPVNPSIMLRRISLALALSSMFWIILSIFYTLPKAPSSDDDGVVAIADGADAPTSQLPLSESTLLAVRWPAFFQPSRGEFDSSGCHCLVVVDSVGRAARLPSDLRGPQEHVAALVPPTIPAPDRIAASLTAEDLWWNLCVLRSARGDASGWLTLLETGDRIPVQTALPAVLAHIQPGGIVACAGQSASSIQVWFGCPRCDGEQMLVGATFELQNTSQNLTLSEIRQWVPPPSLDICDSDDSDCSLQDATLIGASGGLLVTLIRNANSSLSALVAVETNTGEQRFALLAPPGRWKGAAADGINSDTIVLLGEEGDVVLVNASNR